MEGLKTIYDLISKRLEWELDSIVIEQKKEPELYGYYDVVGTDNITKETIEANLYIDDGISKSFDFSRYSNIQSEGKPLIVILKNYQRERYIYTNTKKKSKTFESMWEKKISVYFDSQEPITLKVDKDGINYLEYISDEIEGYIFNVSIAEILKIINVTGINLYRDNVRVGINKSESNRRLKKIFCDYILSSILNDKDFCDEFNIEEALNNQLIRKRNQSLFWFSHNGITIYSKRKKGEEYRINMSSSIIELNPHKISVINGAQTISCFLRASEDINDMLRKINNKRVFCSLGG